MCCACFVLHLKRARGLGFKRLNVERCGLFGFQDLVQFFSVNENGMKSLFKNVKTFKRMMVLGIGTQAVYLKYLCLLHS